MVNILFIYANPRSH